MKYFGTVLFFLFLQSESLSCPLLLTAPEGEPVRYRVEMLALFVLGPVVVLALLSVVSILACRRLHHGRLQRLQEFDTEQGAIDGLITSNVGDSTLAVRTTDVPVETMKRDSQQSEESCFLCLPVLTVCTSVLEKHFPSKE